MYISPTDFAYKMWREIDALDLPHNEADLAKPKRVSSEERRQLAAVLKRLSPEHREAIKRQWSFFLSSVRRQPSRPVVTAAFDVVIAALRSRFPEASDSPHSENLQVTAEFSPDEPSPAISEANKRLTTTGKEKVAAVGSEDTDQHQLAESAPQSRSGWWRTMRIAAVAHVVLVLALGVSMLTVEDKPESESQVVEHGQSIPEVRLLVEARPTEWWYLTVQQVQDPPVAPDVRFLELLSGVDLGNTGLVLYVNQARNTWNH